VSGHDTKHKWMRCWPARALDGERAHKAQIDEVLAAQYEIKSYFSQTESMWCQSASVPVVSNNNVAPNRNNTLHMNVILSMDSGSGNN
jgi:hypothetical protein